MSEIPKELKYTASHEWVRDEGDGTITVGITDHAQELLGDLVYVELPDIGRQVSAKEECCVVESVKAASDVYSPLGGEIVAVNDALDSEPGIVNAEPYGEGWLFQIKVSDEVELENLLSAKDYETEIGEE